MKTIVWDLDDVLNDFMRCWFENIWLPANKDCRHTYLNISENPPHKLLGISLAEYLKSIDNFRLSGIAANIQPVPEVFEWFMKYGGYFRHMVLTARPYITIPCASSWVFKHFGRWIRTFHFVPAVRPGQVIPVYDLIKKDYLEWHGKVDLLIDDDEENVRDAQDLGIKGILMPRPWNIGRKTITETLNILTESAG